MVFYTRNFFSFGNFEHIDDACSDNRRTSWSLSYVKGHLSCSHHATWRRKEERMTSDCCHEGTYTWANLIFLILFFFPTVLFSRCKWIYNLFVTVPFVTQSGTWQVTTNHRICYSHYVWRLRCDIAFYHHCTKFKQLLTQRLMVTKRIMFRSYKLWKAKLWRLLNNICISNDRQLRLIMHAATYATRPHHQIIKLRNVIRVVLLFFYQGQRLHHTSFVLLKFRWTKKPTFDY